MCNAVLIIEIKSAAYATDDVLCALAHFAALKIAKADRKTLKGGDYSFFLGIWKREREKKSGR